MPGSAQPADACSARSRSVDGSSKREPVRPVYPSIEGSGVLGGLSRRTEMDRHQRPDTVRDVVGTDLVDEGVGPGHVVPGGGLKEGKVPRLTGPVLSFLDLRDLLPRPRRIARVEAGPKALNRSPRVALSQPADRRLPWRRTRMTSHRLIGPCQRGHPLRVVRLDLDAALVREDCFVELLALAAMDVADRPGDLTRRSGRWRAVSRRATK